MSRSEARNTFELSAVPLEDVSHQRELRSIQDRSHVSVTVSTKKVMALEGPEAI